MANPEHVEAVLSGEKNLTDFDLKGARLVELDLRGADLFGASLNGADLRGADLRGVRLSRTDLRKADLRGVDLRDATVQSAKVGGALYGFDPMTFWPEGDSWYMNHMGRIEDGGVRVPPWTSLTPNGPYWGPASPDAILETYARSVRIQAQFNGPDCGYGGLGLTAGGRSLI